MRCTGRGKWPPDHSCGKPPVKAGWVSGQARAIYRVLEQVAPQLSTDQQERAETAMVELAERLDAVQLATQAGHVLELVAPETGGELHEQRLQRETETAHRERSLRFWPDGGSLRFDGSLPRMDGETWLTLLNTHVERPGVPRWRNSTHWSPHPHPTATTRGRPDRHDPHPRQRCSAAAPRVVVTIDYDKLHHQAAGAGIIGADTPLSAGELRRPCCDAGILPAVAGTSQILDIGRTIPPAIRTAVTLRDRGCAFPRLRHPPGSLRSTPHRPLVGRWQHRPAEPGAALPPPPRPDRTNPTQHPRPMADIHRHRRHPTIRPTSQIRPQTTPVRHQGSFRCQPNNDPPVRSRVR